MNEPSASLPSFAKINWNLQILGKRSDGLHEIRTVLQTVSLCDQLHFTVAERDDVSLTCTDPDIPTDENNLVFRAALALKDRFHITRGARIHLEKTIPTKAGLGGASSNAAVALLALARLCKTGATMTELLQLAATLGADVPFFLVGGRALATGTGTTISPLDEVRPQSILIIAPNASIATVDAYAALKASALTTNSSAPILSSSPETAISRDSQLWRSIDELNNDFEPVIFDMEPEIRRAKQALLQAGARAALLAGSGSSVFGIFSGREDQESARSKIAVEAGWRIFACDTLSRTEYNRTLGL